MPKLVPPVRQWALRVTNDHSTKVQEQALLPVLSRPCDAATHCRLGTAQLLLCVLHTPSGLWELLPTALPNT